MNKISKSTILCAVSAVLFLVFWSISVYYGKYVGNHLSGVSARYDTGAVTASTVKETLKRLKQNPTVSIPEITLWNRLGQETIQNVELGKSTKVPVIETNGDMSQVIPMKFICGNYVYPGDWKGCVLDSKTADQLFGTTDAVSNIVAWKEKKYIVRGVVKAKDTMMLFQLAAKNHEYANVEAVYANGKHNGVMDNQGKQLKDLITQMGVQKEVVILEGDLTARILYAMYHLPLWIIALEMILLPAKAAYRYRKSSVLCVSLCFLTLAAAAILIRITNFKISIPGQFIPTKWSDFDFYVNKYKEIQDSIVKIANCKHMPKDSLRDHCQNACIVFTALDMLMLFLVKLQLRNEGKL
jgi:hypothetical protein